jgi:hypothetical protein
MHTKSKPLSWCELSLLIRGLKTKNSHIVSLSVSCCFAPASLTIDCFEHLHQVCCTRVQNCCPYWLYWYDNQLLSYWLLSDCVETVVKLRLREVLPSVSYGFHSRSAKRMGQYVSTCDLVLLDSQGWLEQGGLCPPFHLHVDKLRWKTVGFSMFTMSMFNGSKIERLSPPDTRENG